MLRAKHLAALALLAAALLALASVSHRQALALRAQVSEIDRHVLVPSPGVARILAMGYNELAADLVWVRMLVYYGDGLVHDTGMPDTEALVRLVNTLDPRFRKPYIWGAYATTFRNRFATPAEYRASVEVLRRAVEQYPDDWEFAWVLGLRLFLDVKATSPEEETRLKEEGAAYIERAMRLPKAPSDLPLLAASFRSRLGQKEHALRDLREMILNTQDEKGRQELVNRYAALVSETASHELADAAAELDAAWKKHLPYASRTLYILLGPPPSAGFDLDAAARADLFSDGTSLAPSKEQ